MPSTPWPAAERLAPPFVAGPPPASAFVPCEPDPAQIAIALQVPGLSDAPEDEVWELVWGARSVRNVTRPTLIPFLPEPGRATGTAVIVAPGGGFMGLSIETEGTRVARRLADAGIAAFVLKYRLDPTPRDAEGFVRTIIARVSGGGLDDPSKPWPEFPAEALALEDGLAAVRTVRAQCAAYGLRADRVGFMGFSAGGMVTMRVALAAPPAEARPDFIAPIYGAMDLRRPVPADAPPMFLALAADDRLLAHMGVPMFNAWRQAGRPVELHVYESGGHGFGARSQGTSSDHWFDSFLNWLGSRGLLAQPRGSAPSAR